jgi:phosphatidylethanolamine/phosphatidyl-N-methylethanolamine N-methyltransferase
VRINTVPWNRWRWSLFAPLYDRVRFFSAQRRRSIGLLDLKPGERVLMVGAGPAHELSLLPAGAHVLVTDVAPGMIARARRHGRAGVDYAVMDGAKLELAGACFDAAILHLVLAVMPDPVGCVREVARVLKPGGRVAVLDKFLADDARPGAIRRLVNAFSVVVATDLNRRFGDILRAAGAPLSVVHDEPAAFGGYVRILILRKLGSTPVGSRLTPPTPPP